MANQFDLIKELEHFSYIKNATMGVPVEIYSANPMAFNKGPTTPARVSVGPRTPVVIRARSGRIMCIGSCKKLMCPSTHGGARGTVKLRVIPPLSPKTSFAPSRYISPQSFPIYEYDFTPVSQLTARDFVWAIIIHRGGPRAKHLPDWIYHPYKADDTSWLHL